MAKPKRVGRRANLFVCVCVLFGVQFFNVNFDCSSAFVFFPVRLGNIFMFLLIYEMKGLSHI